MDNFNYIKLKRFCSYKINEVKIRRKQLTKGEKKSLQVSLIKIENTRK